MQRACCVISATVGVGSNVDWIALANELAMDHGDVPRQLWLFAWVIAPLTPGGCILDNDVEAVMAWEECFRNSLVTLAHVRSCLLLKRR